MKRKLALTLAAAGLMTGTAGAAPKDVPQYVFPTAEECMAALNTLWRGNHAFYCLAGPDGWQIAYDQGYEAARKGPKNK